MVVESLCDGVENTARCCRALMDAKRSFEMVMRLALLMQLPLPGLAFRRGCLSNPGLIPISALLLAFHSAGPLCTSLNLN
jgi:hypothetical protein